MRVQTAASRFRRSSRSLGDAGAGKADRALAGTSRFSIRTAVSRAVRYVLQRPQIFLVTSSDARMLRPTLEAAAAPWPPPTDAEMERDVASLEMVPLFDGGALERI